MILGYIAAIFCSSWMADSVQWRAMISLGTIIPLIMIFVSVAVLAESPRFLVLRNRDEEAKAILMDTYPEGKTLTSRREHYDPDPLKLF